MTARNRFAVLLTGGHPNSLGRTIEVVDAILADPPLLKQLYQCYFDDDEVVRLRTSNAMKRLWRQQPAWFPPYLDRFMTEIAHIDQSSTRWTLAQMFLELDDLLTADQRRRAIAIVRHNLAVCDDWIVISHSLEALGHWARHDPDLRDWLEPRLAHYLADQRRSVAGKARKLFDALARL